MEQIKQRLHGLQEYSIYFILGALALILTIATGGDFLAPTNITNVIRQVSVIGILAYGVTFVIITAGIDLSSGAGLALVSVVVASLMQTDVTGTFVLFENLPTLPIILPVLVGLLVGLLIGFTNGSLVVWGKIPPFIATLGMFTAARGIAFLYSDGRPLSGLNPSFNEIGQGFFLKIPNPVWILLICGAIAHIILKHTKLGRYIFALGANKRAAYVSGINTDLCTLFVYVFAGAMIAVASIVQTTRIGSGQAGLGLSYELFAIAASVIGGTSLNGGKGSIIGTFTGALIIGVLRNGMDILSFSPYWQQVILGIIIVIAVIIDQQKNKVKS